jgi:hypothetical protein
MILYLKIVINLSILINLGQGRDSSVGIATGYGLDGPGIQSRWGERFFEPVQTGPEAHPNFCAMCTGSFPGVKRPERGADHPTLLSSRLRKSRAKSLPLSGPSGLLPYKSGEF